MKLMLEAAQHGRSMAEIEIDPAKVMGIPRELSEGAGKIFVAVAGGPSIQKLKTAIAIAGNLQ